jgi:hypothetical protein
VNPGDVVGDPLTPGATVPHPVRVLASTCRIVSAAAVTGIVVVAVIAGDLDDPVVLLRWLAAVAAVAAIGAALLGRSARRHPPAMRTWAGEATVTIARPSVEVWGLIRPAEFAAMVEPETVQGFRNPGTPVGVGEQQVFIARCPDGSTTCSVVEVVGETPGVWAEIRSVTSPPIGQRWRLATVPGGTQLTYSIGLSALRWAPYGTHPRKQAEAAARAHVEQVKRVIESQPPPLPRQ